MASAGDWGGAVEDDDDEMACGDAIDGLGGVCTTRRGDGDWAGAMPDEDDAGIGDSGAMDDYGPLGLLGKAARQGRGGRRAIALRPEEAYGGVGADDGDWMEEALDKVCCNLTFKLPALSHELSAILLQSMAILPRQGGAPCAARCGRAAGGARRRRWPGRCSSNGCVAGRTGLRGRLADADLH